MLRPLCVALVLCAALTAARPSRSPSTLNVEELKTMSKDELINLLLAKNGQTVHTTSSAEESVLTGVSSSASASYWWKYSNQDCGYDDISRACLGQSVDACKALCEADSTCGGFNTNGYLKKKDCYSKKGDCPGCNVDLWVLEDTPQPIPDPWNAAWPPVWPVPASFSNGSLDVEVSSPLSYKAVGGAIDSHDIQHAMERFNARTFTHRTATGAAAKDGVLSTVVIEVDDGNAPLQLETDESYSLEVLDASNQISIKARTQVGAMHALETLSQLIRFDFDSQQFHIRGAPWAINDAPRFKHRELLMDSSRHFQPVASIKALLESMTYAKVNVLHWHIVDHQSFPFDSPSRPLLSRMGAYSPDERYSMNDVEDVIEFARARGIRVVVEIDNPGHADSWCAGYPEICPSSTCLQPLNPAHNLTFDVITDLFRDLTGGVRGQGPFFDNFLHLGGDEVDTSCWDKTPEIAQWMKDRNLTAQDTYFYFVGKSQDIGRSMGRDVVGWEEIWNAFGTKLDKSTVLQVWLDANTAKSIVTNGYRTLFSPYQLWYLDYLGNDWLKMYNVEPCDGIPDEACNTYLLGGGGEMWGETVDISDLQQTVWPRMAAIAERLWSPRTTTDTAAAEARLLSFRCLLNRRGVSAAPVLNGQARTAPPGPGGCYGQ